MPSARYGGQLIMKLSYKALRAITVIYAILPIIIFYIGWLTPIAALIFSLLTISGLVFFLRSKNSGECSYAEISAKQLAAVAAIAVFWCFLAGQGGFVHQSTDHIIRNAIFRDMIKQPWPVIYDNDQLLSYYIAHWIVPAAVGKGVLTLSDSVGAGLLAGRIALLIWSSIGIFLSLLLISVITAQGNKCRAILSSLLLIFFSGADILGSLITDTCTLTHLEWWAEFAQFSSVTTCLFWVYNQFIVILPLTLCIINETSTENFAFLGLLMFPYGPFPFLGIVMICLLKAAVLLIGKYREKKLSEGIKETLSPQNLITAAAVGLPYALYYMSNPIVSNDVSSAGGAAVNTGFRLHDKLSGYILAGSASDTAGFLLKYLLFLLLEAGAYLLILFIYYKKHNCRKTVFMLSSATLLLIPLFQMGTAYDFSMRVSVPAVIYIAVEFIRMLNAEIPAKLHIKDLRSLVNEKPLTAAAVLIFCLGAFTPICEFNREISKTISIGAEKETDDNYLDSLNDYEYTANFASPNYRYSLFYKYLRKK